MKFKLLYTLLFVLTGFCACKKEKESVEVKKPLIEEGSASDPYDIRINLDEYGYIQARTWFWGRNSDELFVTTHKGPVRIDLRTKKAELITNPGDQGAFVGKTHENSGILFFGKVKGVNGVYIYQFSNNKVEGLFPQGSGGRIHMAGNTIFYSTGSLESIGPPCGAFSIGCSNAISKNSLYHINTITKEFTQLPSDLMVVCFSKDGSKTLLTKQSELLYYIFDNQSRIITDTLGILHGTFNNDGSSTFYYDNTVIKSFSQDIQTKDFSVVNAVTNEVLHKFSSTSYLGDVRWSTDGSKLFYGAYTGSGNSTINIYDLTTGQERTIWSYRGGLFALSDDAKKLLVTDESQIIYIKAVQ